MFDLQREVEAWTEKAYAGPCHAKAATLAEFQDHLYCEVERLEAEGQSREEAFRMATATLGASAGETIGFREDRALRQGRIANAILWAALIVATALVLSNSAVGDSAAFLLTVVCVPLWFASDLLLTRFLRPAGDG